MSGRHSRFERLALFQTWRLPDRSDVAGRDTGYVPTAFSLRSRTTTSFPTWVIESLLEIDDDQRDRPTSVIALRTRSNRFLGPASVDIRSCCRRDACIGPDQGPTRTPHQ